MNWKDMTFGKKIAVGFGTVLTLLAAVGLLSFMGTNEVQWGLMAAATIVAVIPLFILALLVQRYMIRGLTFGAVK